MSDDNIAPFGQRNIPQSIGGQSINPADLRPDAAANHPQSIKEILRQTAEVGEFGRLVASSARLLDTKRALLLRGDRDHTVAQARTVADGRRELEELRHRIKERLRLSEAAWARQRESLVDEITRLEMMQEAADG